MNKLLKEVNIDEKFTKPIKPKPKRFTKVKNNIPLLENYNFMADLLFLPKDKKGFRYLLVVVDLADNSFDIEPLKSKEPTAVLNGLKTVFARPYLKEPKGSIQTDAGTEFKGVFHRYLFNKNILHKTTLPGRHSQQSVVERLNRTLGRLFNGYMNKKEFDTGKVYREWTDIVSVVRRKLNAIREQKLPDIFDSDFMYEQVDWTKDAKYKVGDIVYRAYDEPRNVLGQKQSGTFREGDLRWDLTPRKVTQVLRYPGAEPFRYMVSRIENASFTERQLMSAEESEEEERVVELLTRAVDEDDNIFFKVRFKGQSRKKALEGPWYDRERLMEDIPQMVRDFES